jgi:hypothetical protein
MVYDEGRIWVLFLFPRWMPTWDWRGHRGAKPGFLLESPSKRLSATGRSSTMPPSAAGGHDPLSSGGCPVHDGASQSEKAQGEIRTDGLLPMKFQSSLSCYLIVSQRLQQSIAAWLKQFAWRTRGSSMTSNTNRNKVPLRPNRPGRGLRGQHQDACQVCPFQGVGARSHRRLDDRRPAAL